MTGETQARLITMANQIARNFEALGHDNAVAATTDHLVKFWDPRMRAQIVALAAERGGELGSITRAAVAQLGRSGEPASHPRHPLRSR